MGEVRILGADGRPLPSVRHKTSALAGGNGHFGYGGTPYDAASHHGQHMAEWSPYLWSPDGELNQYRDRIVSRARDLVRNDGWASGSVTRVLDNAIGANFRPISKPDHRFLATYSGNAAFDAVWAKEFSSALDAHWRSWSDDPGHYCDAARNMTFGQMCRVAFRHELVDGDALAVMQWIPARLGLGRARYCTAVQLVDPDRLSNPNQVFDSQITRGGVEVDEYGAAIAYWIRKAHQGDWFSAAESQSWERVQRETRWGRPVVVHHFVGERAGQHRGGAGIFTPIMQRLKMLVKYDETEVDAALINAIFGAYIESPFDPSLVQQAMGEGGALPEEDVVSGYQTGRADFHRERRLSVNGAQIQALYPGEKMGVIAAARPAGNFADFESAILRNVASGLGLSAQQVSNNWSDVNYSSARAAMLEAWKTLARRRHDFAAGFAAKVRTAWLEECFDTDDLPMPLGEVPQFLECPTAYARCKWLGPGKGAVDPKAEVEGSILKIAAGLSTYEIEVAELMGEEYEDIFHQRGEEQEMVDRLKLPFTVGLPGGASQKVDEAAAKV